MDKKKKKRKKDNLVLLAVSNTVRPKERDQVNSGSTFPQWSYLKDETELKSHAKAGTFLLD